MTARVAVLSAPAWVPDFIPEGVRVPCRDEDPELFFAIGDAVYSERALAACRRCPVTQACGQYATGRGISDGLWGGLTPAQRAKRRRLQAVAT